MSKNFNKFLISIFAISALVFGAFHNDASASFWDWFKLRGNSEQIQQVQQTQQATAIANAATTYKWVNNGLVSESEGRYTGSCGIESTSSNDYVCNYSTKGNKLYDGTDRGSSYGDTGNAWPIYRGENTSTAKKYIYDSSSCGLAKRTGGTVNEWECKSSDSTSNTSSSSSSSSGGSSSSSSSSATSANHTGETGSATNITSTSATLNGTVNPKGENVYYIFAYIKESDASSSDKNALTKYSPSGYKFVGGGSRDISLNANISGLSSNTTYLYRFFTYSSATKKFANGGVKSFTTSSGGTTSSSSSSSSSSEQYTLKVKISGAGKVSGGGINCVKTKEGEYKEGSQGICSAKINKGTEVTLYISEPSIQYEFAIWADNCRSFNDKTSCNFNMNGDKTVSATFNKKGESKDKTATVSVRKIGEGAGKIISIYSGGRNSGKEDGRINCGTNCSDNYETTCVNIIRGEGGESCTLVYFKAVPEKGSAFGGWGGDCMIFKGVKDQCYVSLNGDKTITANFNEGSGNTEGKYYDLTVTVSEGGKVESTDNKISCDSVSSPCKHSYGKNGTVTLQATPNSGYVYAGGNNVCTGNANRNKGIHTCKVKMTKNQSLKVNFKASGTTSSSSSSSSFSFSTNLKVRTESANNITSNSATLNGAINPKGENVYYRFYYVQRGQPGTQKTTTWTSVSGSSDISATANISGLSSGTTYNFAIHAYSFTSKKFTPLGGVKSFTTLGGSSVSSSSSSSSSSSQTTASSWKLKVTVSGTGKVEDNYSKISCGSNMTCQATYSKGQVITLKTDDFDSEGKSFGTKVDIWSGGGCSGTGNSCFVTMDGDKEITIKFVSK